MCSHYLYTVLCVLPTNNQKWTKTNLFPWPILALIISIWICFVFLWIISSWTRRQRAKRRRKFDISGHFLVFFFFRFAPKCWQTKMIFLASTMAHPQLVDWDEGIWMNRDIDFKGSWILTWKTTHTHTQKEESIVLTKKRTVALLLWYFLLSVFYFYYSPWKKREEGAQQRGR